MSRASFAQGPAARIAIGACAFWLIVCLSTLARNGVRNPMTAHKAALEARVAAVTFVPEDLPEPDKAPMKAQRKTIVDKEALWRPLVEAPAAPPPPESKPDLLEKLKGVTASARDEIRVGDSLKIKIHTNPEDKRGRWVGAGDKVNGLTILEIKADTVVFALEQNGKQFTAELPRR